MFQKDMQPVMESTQRVLCDMCVAGELRHPNSHELLRKRTQVWTTSAIMASRLERLQCPGTHQHVSIAGSCRTPGKGRQTVSSYTENYTKRFAQHLSRIIQCSLQVKENHEHSLSLACHAAYAAEIEDTNPSKRRRLNMKSPADALYEPLGKVDNRAALEPLLHRFEELAPRVGKRIITEGPCFDSVQNIFPNMQVQAIELRKGVDRLRTMDFPAGKGTHRWTFGRERKLMQFFSDQEWENLSNMSHRQKIRSGTPARIAITVFAHPKVSNRETEEIDRLPESNRPESEEGTVESTPTDGKPVLDSPDAADGDLPNVPAMPKPMHGPMFRALPVSVQTQIIRMHKNLGHPNVEQFGRALHDHGWSPAIQQAIRDMSCDTCHEVSLPKASRPGHLHEARDFNDMVQFDGVEWKDPQGKQYCFYHFVDTATNFQMAVPYNMRTTSSLIHCFQTAWLSWAGPPKSLMFDSATESNSEGFAQYLQELGITSYVIPTDGHWQLGRAERHGAILQRMLDKLYIDKPFHTPEAFEQSLIQCCNAKNSMSRVREYTPELLVLGKSRRLPGSVCDDLENSSNISALQTESHRFAQQLALREAARTAFVKADHCSELRRALHGRSRPDRNVHQVGDWTMYWKNNRWNGPARVLMLDGNNVIWLSHLTRLLRCAPEHVRTLSDRETGALKRDDPREPPPVPGTGVFQYHQLSETPPGPDPTREEATSSASHTGTSHSSSITPIIISTDETHHPANMPASVRGPKPSLMQSRTMPRARTRDR